MTFSLAITYNSATYTFQVERLELSQEVAKNFERFKLSAGDRVVILQSNRPMLKRKGLKHVPVYWKVLEGVVKYQKALELVQQQIEKKLRGEVEEPEVERHIFPVVTTFGRSRPFWKLAGDKPQLGDRNK